MLSASYISQQLFCFLIGGALHMLCYSADLSAVKLHSIGQKMHDRTPVAMSIE